MGYLIFLIKDGKEIPYTSYPRKPSHIALCRISKNNDACEVLARGMRWDGVVYEFRQQWEHGDLYEDYEEKSDE